MYLQKYYRLKSAYAIRLCRLTRVETFLLSVKFQFQFVTHCAKRDFIEIAKSIDRGQTAQFAQSDHGRTFSHLADFLYIKR